MNNDFGQVGNEFINLYSKENPIMNINESCYFLFTNNNDYHRPMVAKGIIVDDKFTDGVNKVYYIVIQELLESPKVIQEFFNECMFNLFPYSNDDKNHIKKLTQINRKFDLKANAFKIESFFVRNTEEKILELRKEYISIIRKDILKQLADIDNI